jgi:hypothetical protein
MQTLCNAIRGRVGYRLGVALIAALALVCPWGFALPLAADDGTAIPLDKPAKSEPVPQPPKPQADSLPLKEIPPAPPVQVSPPPPPAARTTTLPGLPPVARDGAAVSIDGPAVPSRAAATTAITPDPAPTDIRDIKQLMAQLGEIRVNRAKLDEQERQTIEIIKRTYQEQKKVLEQLERELRQLGINCEEKNADKVPERDARRAP